MKFSKFITNKGVVYAILVAIFYQIAMVGLNIYGYHVLPGGVQQLAINVVNEDGEKGKEILKQLAANLPFKNVATDKELNESKNELDNRQIQMIIVIPPNFAEGLQAGKSALDFYINESNTATEVTAMKEVAKSITGSFNNAINQGKLADILKSFQMNEASQKMITQKLQNSVAQNNIYMNKAPDSMNYVMAPTFLSIAAYISSMVATVILVNILIALTPVLGKWKAFRFIEWTGGIIAILAPLFGVVAAALLLSLSFQKILLLYCQQVFMQMASFQFALIFSLLLGQNGIFINMPLVLAQTIAGGGIMPLQIIPDLFKTISYITPMYPNTQINFGILFGGPILSFEKRLAAIFIISSLILLAIVRVKRKTLLTAMQ